MEFLVEIKVDLPRGFPNARELLKEEVRIGLRLREEGTILILCENPEGMGNIGIWRADDEPALRSIIDSLPLRQHMTCGLTPLEKLSGQ